MQTAEYLADHVGLPLLPSALNEASRAETMRPFVVKEAIAALLTGMSTRNLQWLRVTGDGPPYIILSPGRIGYAVADLQQWVASRRVSSTSAATVANRAAA